MKTNNFLKEIESILNVSGLEWIGEGMNGDAYKTNCGKCVKFTSDKYEAAFSFEMMNKNHGSFVNTHSVKKMNDGSYLILMDLLDVDDASDVYKQMERLSLDLGIHYSEIDYSKQDIFDYKKIEKFANDLKKIEEDFSRLGIDLEDIHSGNIGYNSNMDLVLFDQQVMYSKVDLLRILDEIENQEFSNLTLYHGTSEENDFDKFSSLRAGERITSLGYACYLSVNYELASCYGDNVMKFNCNLNNILDWNNLTPIKREMIELKLIDCVPKDRIAGFGEEKEIIVKEDKEGLNKFRILQEKTKDYYHESARAQIKDYNEDGTITISYRVPSSLKLANNQQLMTLMNEYCPNLASDLGYKASKFGDQVAIYDFDIPIRQKSVSLDLEDIRNCRQKKPSI